MPVLLTPMLLRRPDLWIEAGSARPQTSGGGEKLAKTTNPMPLGNTFDKVGTRPPRLQLALRLHFCK